MCQIRVTGPPGLPVKLSLLPESHSRGQTSTGPRTPCESRLAEVAGRLPLTVGAQTSGSRFQGQRGKGVAPGHLAGARQWPRCPGAGDSAAGTEQAAAAASSPGCNAAETTQCVVTQANKARWKPRPSSGTGFPCCPGVVRGSRASLPLDQGPHWLRPGQEEDLWASAS